MAIFAGVSGAGTHSHAPLPIHFSVPAVRQPVAGFRLQDRQEIVGFDVRLVFGVFSFVQFALVGFGRELLESGLQCLVTGKIGKSPRLFGGQQRGNHGGSPMEGLL